MPKIKELIQPPPEPEGDGEQQLAALRDYLVKITQELYYLLTHLEADNINDSTFQRISEMIPKPYVGQPLMDGTASSGGSGNWSRGDHRHPADTSKADVTALEEEAALLAAHVGDHTNPHEVTAAQVGLEKVANVLQYSVQNPPPIPTPGEVGAVPVTRKINGHALSADVTLDHTDVGAIPSTAKGSAGGVAELDSNGMVPSAQLPSYVDDVLEYASLSSFPVTGESGKIYVALDTGRTYRWSGSAYVEISESLALGETSSTAYRGDRGKTAYDHSQLTSGNPHNVTAADIGAATAQDLTDHVGDTTNPHGVTAAQAGARPDTWMPTAADVGARADTWMPTAADVGARPNTWTPSKSDIGLGSVEDERQYSVQNPPPYPVTSVNGSTGAVVLDASDVGARADDWVPSASDVGAQPTITASGILKGDGAGGVSAATAGTDYQTPLTAGTDYQTPLTAGTDYATPVQLAAKAPFFAGVFPGTSSTAGGTQAKIGTVPDLAGLTALYDGLCICMTFANAQTYAGQPTLDIGIPYNGATTFGINRTTASAAGQYDWGTGSAVDLVFDASTPCWVIKKGQHGSAVRYGVLLLSDSTSDTSSTNGGVAATPAAVKAAYDLAFNADTKRVLPYWIDCGTISSLPLTIPDEIAAGDTVDMWEIGTPSAMKEPWTVTTADGSLTISGSINGTTTLKLHLTPNQ